MICEGTTMAGEVVYEISRTLPCSPKTLRDSQPTSTNVCPGRNCSPSSCPNGYQFTHAAVTVTKLPAIRSPEKSQTLVVLGTSLTLTAASCVLLTAAKKPPQPTAYHLPGPTKWNATQAFGLATPPTPATNCLFPSITTKPFVTPPDPKTFLSPPPNISPTRCLPRTPTPQPLSVLLASPRSRSPSRSTPANFSSKTARYVLYQYAPQHLSTTKQN